MEGDNKLALFEQSIVPHLNAAYNLSLWLTRNTHDAEDVVQEAYLRAFRFFDGFKGGDGKAWLLAVVRNTWLSWLRKRKGDSPAVAFDEQTHSPERERSNTESTLVEKAKLGSLQECIELLPIEYREVVVLRELEEMPYKDIADVAGIPLGTVMSRLSRGRKRLEDCVAARMNGGSR